VLSVQRWEHARMTNFPCMNRSRSSTGETRYSLDDPLADSYLEFVAGRARANTLRAIAFDLKTFSPSSRCNRPRSWRPTCSSSWPINAATGRWSGCPTASRGCPPEPSPAGCHPGRAFMRIWWPEATHRSRRTRPPRRRVDSPRGMPASPTGWWLTSTRRHGADRCALQDGGPFGRPPG